MSELYSIILSFTRFDMCDSMQFLRNTIDSRRTDYFIHVHYDQFEIHSVTFYLQLKYTEHLAILKFIWSFDINFSFVMWQRNSFASDL
jgi:hypothetical protein